MKSKQYILNAFRERFGEHEVLCGLEEYPHAKCSCEYPEIIKWLLTTLTEFEREIKSKQHDTFMYEEDKFACCRNCGCVMPRNGWPSECRGKVTVELRDAKLEKEKHPSK